MEKTKLGLPENIEAMLSYLLGPLSGIIFLIIERQNKFISFHAMQSIITFGVLSIIIKLAGWIPLIDDVIVWGIGLVIIVLKVALIYFAFSKKIFKVPFIGDIVWNQIYNS